LPPKEDSSVTKQEKKRLSVVLRATEYLFLENIALKLVLEHREVPNWQKLLARLLEDKEMLAGIRPKLRDILRRAPQIREASSSTFLLRQHSLPMLLRFIFGHVQK
jgi:hypothetical protein